MHRSTVLFVSLVFPTIALAHGDVGDGFLARLVHVLTSAEHLGVLAMLVAAGVLVRRILLRLRAHRARTAQGQSSER
jgi:hypothetical protein